MRIAIVMIAIMISIAPRPTNTPIKIAVVLAPLGEPDEENAPEGIVSGQMSMREEDGPSVSLDPLYTQSPGTQDAVFTSCWNLVSPWHGRRQRLAVCARTRLYYVCASSCGADDVGVRRAGCKAPRDPQAVVR